MDPTNGDPQGYLNGAVSKDYLSIVSNTPVDSLVYKGSSRPTVFGAVLNSFYWKGFTLSFNITYKFGYYFRRSSTGINATDALTYPTIHMDYINRWQKPGDENNTNVPSVIYPANSNRNLFYQNAEVLVEKGDQVRLQNINIAYTLDNARMHNLPFSQVQLYAFVNNLGLLWKANHAGIDPDYNTLYAMPDPKSITLGLKFTL